MDQVRVAVIGCWHVHAGDYAGRAREHPGTTLVAIWDDDRVRGAAAAADFGAAHTDDLAGVLARDDIDAVIVTTSTDMHRDVMVQAARRGKHIFTEKVLAPTVDEADEIIAAADAAGVALVVSLPRLYHGYTQGVVDAIASGVLGRISYARVRLSHDGAVTRDGAPGWLPERFFEPATAIGGALTDLGCHPVYLTQLFLGAEPETVSAVYRSVSGHALEDHAVVTVGYADQSIGVIEAGFVSPAPFTIEVGGSDGVLAYTSDGNALTLVGSRSTGRATSALPVPDDGPDAFDQWVGHIANGTRADDNLARARELTRLVVAANRSAAEGRAVRYRTG